MKYFSKPAITSVVISVVGIVLIIIGFWERDNDFRLSLLVNIGTLFMFAYPVEALSQWINKNISKGFEEVKETVSTQVQEEVERRIGPSLDDLQNRFGVTVTTSEEKRERTIANMDNSSFETTLEAFDAADQLRAIKHYEESFEWDYNPVGILASCVVVPADHKARTRIRFKRVRHKFLNEFDKRNVLGECQSAEERKKVSEPYISVEVLETAEPVVWFADMDSETMGTKVVEGLQRNGVWKPDLINWGTALNNLRRALLIAVQRRHNSEANLWKTSSEIFELLDEHWVVSAEGLECNNPHAFYSLTNFLKPQEWPLEWPPPPIGGLDEITWHSYLRRALTHFKIRDKTQMLSSIQDPF